VPPQPPIPLKQSSQGGQGQVQGQGQPQASSVEPRRVEPAVPSRYSASSSRGGYGDGQYEDGPYYPQPSRYQQDARYQSGGGWGRGGYDDDRDYRGGRSMNYRDDDEKV
jgi:hypothetical protein